MFQSLSIRGFRGFENLTVDGLDRFNLFLGRNNVGKTALLEALFLLAGPTNPELTFKVNIFRGTARLSADAEETWGWLFRNKNLTNEVVLDLVNGDGKKRSLKIQIEQRSEITNGNSESSQSNGVVSTVKKSQELVLSYRSETGAETVTKAVCSQKGIEFEADQTLTFPTSVCITSSGGFASENPERFSKLQEVGRENEILPALQVLEPRLQKMSVLVVGGVPMIHGDIGLGRMAPMYMMGEGVGRLLTMLLAITAAEGGMVMVDEIDSGFHYSILDKVWTAVATLAREMDVQVFATTHSWECLKAAHDSFSASRPYDFRLHRLDMIEGESTSTTYDEEMVATALSSGMELR